MVCLQETKIQSWEVGLVRNFGVGRFLQKGGEWMPLEQFEAFVFSGITEFLR